jgi:Response regulator containing CheY-like receiver, AAA-type ATPase, and DNA-binding domains
MNGKKIMIVDNEEPICDLYKRVFLREGFDVEAYTDGAKAIERIKKKKFDLVLTDLKMPYVDGFDVIRMVREISPETIIIVVSGYPTIESVVRSVRLGAVDYIMKPFEVPDLLTKVKKCLAEEAGEQPEPEQPEQPLQ